MGKVQEIVVENFKSYQGRQQIGPFRRFTCVVGPNGAGKSNLMDAISFVLGVQARVLRSEKLRDLVYRKEGEDPKKNDRSGYVELTYVGEESDGADAAALTLIFRRSILRGGEGRFQVNGETVSQADYHKRLESINILSKVRNFLVFQGDVEAVAQRQGKDLTAFFEQISGSEAFKQEYERLAAEKAKTEDNARFLFTKKRNAINEKKRVAQQKDEADEYLKVEQQYRDLQLEFVLFRLHGLQCQQDEAGVNLRRAEEQQSAQKAELAATKVRIEEAEREKAQAHLATTQAERALAGSRAKLEKLNPERVMAQTRIAFLRQRLEDLRQHSEKEGRRRERLDAQAGGLRSERDKLEVEENGLQERLKELENRFSPSQRAEFERVRGEAERVMALHGNKSRALELQIRAVQAERTRAEHEQREVDALCEHLTSRVAEAKDFEASARVASEQTKNRAHHFAGRREQLRTSVMDRSDEKEQLLEERKQIMNTIQDIVTTERELTRERELVKTCAGLTEAVPGVHGRVLDLCRPAQKRLHVAVNVALGKFLDAIVVDTGATARRCVRYLKERLLPPMTFLPLDDLRMAARDPRLEAVVNETSSLRLALNCVSFDERVARAFEFLLGEVVVADTMADGRRLAFGDARALGLSCKVVTLAGEAIAKNGNLSVNSDATREGATRFDLAELDAAKGRLGAIDRRLSGLQSVEASNASDLLTVTDEARQAEAKAVEADAKLKRCEYAIAQKSEELRGAEEKRSKVKPEAERLRKKEAELLTEQRRLEEHLSRTVASYFAQLGAEMGEDDIQKVEREWRREREAAQARMDEVSRRLRNARAELTMIEQTLAEQAANDREALEPKLRAELEQFTNQLATVSTDTEALTNEMNGWEARVKEHSKIEENREKVVIRLRLEGKEKRHDLVTLEKKISDLRSSLRQLNDLRTDVLRQSVLDDLEVPLLEGGAEALQDIAEAPSQPTEASVQRDGQAEIAIDFAALPEEKKAASVGPAAKMLEGEYKAEVDRLHGELVRRSPNLKASEQMEGASEHLQAAAREADAARREIEDIDAQFEAVRRARKDRFLDCFSKVSSEISAVYRRLTANTAGLHCDGGSAFLDLEDTEDPFNGGIKFTAMPPAKRYRDMSLLSGGEKTLAAMALLFSVHAYQQPPFMVLDEVDAALDANNVQALASYVEQANLQTIVISLKDRFFIRGEALVGVWKDKPRETSRILTLDLTRYANSVPAAPAAALPPAPIGC